MTRQEREDIRAEMATFRQWHADDIAGNPAGHTNIERCDCPVARDYQAAARELSAAAKYQEHQARTNDEKYGREFSGPPRACGCAFCVGYRKER